MSLIWGGNELPRSRSGHRAEPDRLKEVVMASRKKVEVAEKVVYIVGSRDIQQALEKHGIVCLNMWDGQYRNAESLAQAAIANAAEGIRTVFVLDPSISRYINMFRAARRAFHGLEFIGVVDPEMKGAKNAIRQLKSGELPGILNAFKGWYYLQGDATLSKEEAVGLGSQLQLLKSFKELAGVAEKGRKDLPFDHCRISQGELIRLWNDSHPNWMAPARPEAVRGELVDILEFYAGIGELPPRFQHVVGFDTESRRGDKVIRENNIPDDDDSQDPYLNETS